MPIERSAPYPQFNFQVEIDGVGSTGFAEVSGVDMHLPLVAYRNGSDRSHQLVPVGPGEIVTLTLTRGMAGNTDLFEWFEQARTQGAAASRDLRISILNEERDPAATWGVRNALPTRLRTPGLNAQGSELAIEELELKATAIALLD